MESQFLPNSEFTHSPPYKPHITELVLSSDKAIAEENTVNLSGPLNPTFKASDTRLPSFESDLGIGKLCHPSGFNNGIHAECIQYISTLVFESCA